MEYSVTKDGATGTGSISLVRGRGQVLRCDWQGVRLEYRQSPAGAVVVRHDIRGYDEALGSKEMSPPSPRLTSDVETIIPFFAYFKNLTSFAQGGTWQADGSEDLGGISATIWSVEHGESSRLGGKHSVWITPEARIARWRRTIPTPEGDVAYTFEFKKLDALQDLDPKAFQPELPIGYMPLRLPPPKTKTLSVESKVVLGKWYDARANKTADFAIRAKGSPVLLVFTDPESEICAKIEPLLVELRRSLKRHGCGVVEVVYSASAPTVVGKDKDRSVVWDKDGSIERAYGTPGTPYFLMADAKGVLCRGWQGYRDDERKKIVAHFTGFFTEKKTTDAKPARKG